MSTTPRQALDRLQELVASDELRGFCQTQGIELLVAFGSATDPAREAGARDLDLGVLLEPGTELLAVVNALTDLLHCDAIDMLDLGRAGPVAQEQALVGGVPLCERRPGSFAAIRDRAIVMRMDTDWLRRLDLELMGGR
jgi:predicted nucleotidyltransferase